MTVFTRDVPTRSPRCLSLTDWVRSLGGHEVGLNRSVLLLPAGEELWEAILFRELRLRAKTTALVCRADH